jgi:hypothetical protein
MEPERVGGFGDDFSAQGGSGADIPTKSLE